MKKAIALILIVLVFAVSTPSLATYYLELNQEGSLESKTYDISHDNICTIDVNLAQGESTSWSFFATNSSEDDLNLFVRFLSESTDLHMELQRIDNGKKVDVPLKSDGTGAVDTDKVFGKDNVGLYTLIIRAKTDLKTSFVININGIANQNTGGEEEEKPANTGVIVGNQAVQLPFKKFHFTSYDESLTVGGNTFQNEIFISIVTDENAPESALSIGNVPVENKQLVISEEFVATLMEGNFVINDSTGYVITIYFPTSMTEKIDFDANFSLGKEAFKVETRVIVDKIKNIGSMKIAGEILNFTADGNEMLSADLDLSEVKRSDGNTNDFIILNGNDILTTLTMNLGTMLDSSTAKINGNHVGLSHHDSPKISGSAVISVSGSSKGALSLAGNSFYDTIEIGLDQRNGNLSISTSTFHSTVGIVTVHKSGTISISTSTFLGSVKIQSEQKSGIFSVSTSTFHDKLEIETAKKALEPKVESNNFLFEHGYYLNGTKQ